MFTSAWQVRHTCFTPFSFSFAVALACLTYMIDSGGLPAMFFRCAFLAFRWHVFTHWLTHSHSLTHTHSLTRSLTHSLSHLSLTHTPHSHHSLTVSLTHLCTWLIIIIIVIIINNIIKYQIDCFVMNSFMICYWWWHAMMNEHSSEQVCSEADMSTRAFEQLTEVSIEALAITPLLTASFSSA